jgi:hypothetical protein
VLGTAVLYALVPWLPTAPLVFGALFLAGLLAGALEINLNVQTDRLAAQMGRSLMNRAHGFWSLGFFVTALIGAGVRQAGISIEAHLAGALILVLVIAIYTISGMEDAPVRPETSQEAAPHFAFPTLGLLPLCLIGIAAFLVEGAGVDWSAIYMRDTFAVEPFIGGMGLTLFSFFMAATRLLADAVVDRFGARQVAANLLVLSVVGVLLVGLAPSPWVALVGFALLVTGCSAVYPLAVSAAAQRTDRPASVNVAALGQVTFIVFFLAPPLLGFVAEYIGIRSSYLVCLPLIVLGLWATKALPARLPPAPVVARAEPLSPLG